MFRIVLSAVVFQALSLADAFADDPLRLSIDLTKRPAAASWIPNASASHLSIAAFQQRSAGVAEFQAADLVAPSRNRPLGVQNERTTAAPVSSEFAALVYPLGDPRDVQRFGSHVVPTPPLATSPTMNAAAATFATPTGDASQNLLRPAVAGIGQRTPWLGSF